MHAPRLRRSSILIALTITGVLAACAPPPIPDPGLTAGSLGGLPSQVALTFDDGPNPEWTPRVLDILDRYGVKATFFVVGTEAARHPDLVRQIVARGHSIANHSWSHPQLPKQSDARVRDELSGTSMLIRNLTVGVGPYRTGYIVSCARPPYGSTNARINNTMASLDMRPALWSIDTNDWRRRDPLASTRRAGADAVVLMHDGGGDRSLTVSRLPSVIEDIQARGLGFTKLCDSRA
ncbi:MAG: polysaccharide deacetylase family protein [Actinobacteria bacterium]|nr:polysaccharide deacetylase family protein [Actinomycetota bacterium]